MYIQMYVNALLIIVQMYFHTVLHMLKHEAMLQGVPIRLYSILILNIIVAHVTTIDKEQLLNC